MIRLKPSFVSGNLKRLRHQHETRLYPQTTPNSLLQRYKSTNDKFPSHKAPEINFNPSQGNTLLHQKAARAAELHAELNALLDKQAKRRAEEANRSFGAGFFDFLRKSKSEIINIFAAFTCVLLAWQISNIRKVSRKLLDDAGEKDLRIEKLKSILRHLSNEEFSTRVVKAYEQQLQNSKLVDIEQKGKRWFFGGNVGKMNAVDESQRQNAIIILKAVLENELHNTIGDVALSDYEIEEKKLQTLQKDLGILEMKKVSRKDTSESSSLGGLDNVLVEIQDEGEAHTSVKAIKRKGFI
jgi:hypothetical protein